MDNNCSITRLLAYHGYKVLVSQTTSNYIYDHSFICIGCWIQKIVVLTSQSDCAAKVQVFLLGYVGFLKLSIDDYA